MDHAIGTRLRSAREERGLTPDEIAGAIGIPPEAVTDIEQGDALRHYGPGLAAAWTWAVGRHLGVAIDHELATWQPPVPGEPATGHDPGHAGGEAATADPAPAEPDDAAGRRGDHPLDAPGTDATVREPKITPGWLADYDHDPLESFDPSSTERPEPSLVDGAAPAEPAGDDEFDEVVVRRDRPEAGDTADATTPASTGPEPRSDDLWTQPEDDLWGPDPDADWGTTGGREPGHRAADEDDDPFETMSLYVAEDSRSGGPSAAPQGEDAPPGIDQDVPEHPGVPPEPPGSPTVRVVADEPAPDDTGELPTDSGDTRVLAFTEGDEAAALTAPSRVRTVGVVVAALVVLVGAGVGVGALAARLLDAPADSPASSDGEEVDVGDGDGGDGAGDPQDAGEPAEAPDDDTAESDDAADSDPAGSEPSDEGTSSEIDGDPTAAADPADTTVQILDGSADDDRYTDAQEVLEELGYQVVASGPAASEYDETTVFVSDGFADEGAALAEADERFAHLQPNDVGLNEDVELHVIVGDDWPDPASG